MVVRRPVVRAPAVQAALDRFNAVIALHNLRKKKDCNKRECTKHCTWVEDSNLRLPTSADKFLHRDAVDRHFRDVVAERNGNKNTVSRIGSSLQWCWNFVEETPEDIHLVIQNAVAQRAKRDQNTSWKIREHQVNAGGDPREGLKDLIPVEDRLKILRHVHEHVRKWGSLGVSTAWGGMAALRGAANRALVHADMNLSLGHG